VSASIFLRKIAIALAIVGACGAVVGSAAASEWKCYTYQAAPASPVNIGLQKMADKLKEITGGEINMTCNVGGSLPIDANSIAPAISDGVLDFGSTSTISGYVPLAAIGILPGMFSSNADYDERGWPFLEEIIEEEFDKRNIKVLGIYHYPPQVVLGSKKAPPLKSLFDLKGRTIRVGNPEVADLAKALGAVPVTLPTPDVSPALQRGTVEYVVTAVAAGGRLWHDFFGSAIMDPLYVSVSYIIMNKDRWESLTPDQQEEFQEFVTETSRWITSSQEEDDAVALKEFQEKDGWAVTPGNPDSYAQITKLMEPIWTQWAEERGPEAIELLEKLKAELGHN
jgi:TRAP-type C4-dicarboxylate transport system, periplasmic component